MLIKIIAVLIFLLCCGFCAERIDPPELVQVKMHDESEIVKLAEQQKFLIPRTGQTINIDIQYIPENQGQCEQIPQTITYESLAQSPTVFSSDDEVASILPLVKRQIAFVADPFYNIASYSIDQHFLMKPRIPKSSLLKTEPFQKKIEGIVNPIMVATQNEQYIFYLTTKKSFVFHYSNLASDIKQIEIPNKPQMILKAVLIQSYLILCGGSSGLSIYHINFQTFELKHLQTQLKQTKNGIDESPVDLQFNKNTQLLYILTYRNKIEVFLFNPDENVELQKRKVIFRYDQLSLEKIIYKHDAQLNPEFQPIGNMNIQISLNRQQQIIMILFYHLDKTVVAQISYDPEAKKYFFVRYYKYAVTIKQIHIITDNIMLVVGDGILGMFPYGIDPKLIQEEFNGYMALTSVDKIVVVQPPFFVGINKNQIEYAGVFLDQETGISCHLGQSSKLKQIKFRANLTTCGEQYSLRVSKYCAFEKTFIVKPMIITTSASIAASIWITTIVLTLLLVFGLCCLFAIHKKKERQIRKLELYFEERRRSSEVPASSDRN